MDSLIFFSLFIFGLIIGSFLNVVILRWNTGWSISRGRSKCFSCDKTLRWYELIPVFSFLIQKGECRGCGSKISWQYPGVEVATGLTFAFIPWPIAILVCLYIVIFVYDLRHKIIPDFFSYAAAMVALLLIAAEYHFSGRVDLYRLIGGPILFLFFYFFWVVSRGKWMGLGDAKLALSVGWMLGLWAGIAAILLSFWIGAIVALAVIVYQKIRGVRGLGLRSEIPFGPFILIGFALVLLFGIDIQSILVFLAV